MVNETVRGKIVELIKVSTEFSLEEIQKAITEVYAELRHDSFINAEGTIDEKVMNFFIVAAQKDKKNSHSDHKIRNMTDFQISKIAQVLSIYCDMRKCIDKMTGKQLAEMVSAKLGHTHSHALVLVNRANAMIWKAAASVYEDPELEECSTKWARPIKSIEYFYQRYMRFW